MLCVNPQGSIGDTLIGPFYTHSTLVFMVEFMRHLSVIDHCLGELDKAIRTLIPPQQRVSQRNILPPCSTNDANDNLTPQEKIHIAGLMRVNHSGEVCAQALYQGQALTAKLTEVKTQLAQAAEEENEHLAWCEQRLTELHSRPSLLNPFWYIGSLFIGAAAGLAGDQWSLGFVAETEHQVAEHLQSHIDKLPKQDNRTRVILKQMHTDEAQHAQMAETAGAAELPEPIKKLMRCVAQFMTKTSYHI